MTMKDGRKIDPTDGQGVLTSLSGSASYAGQANGGKASLCTRSRNFGLRIEKITQARKSLMPQLKL